MKKRGSIFLKDKYVLIPLLLGVVMAFKVVFLGFLGGVDQLGSDALIHVYKIELLTEQMKHQPVLLWGSWDWNWFCGYAFLKVYSPLYSFFVAFVSVGFNMSITSSVAIFYCTLYPLSTVAAYFLSYELTKNKLLSVFGSSVYASCPAYIQEIVSNGAIPRLPLYLLMPLSLLFMEKLTESNGKNVKFFVAAVLTFSALMLTHFWYALILTPHLALIMLVKWIFVKRFDVKAFLLIPLSILISAPSTLPLVYYISTEGEVWPGSAPVIPFSNPLETLRFITGAGIGLIAFSTIIVSFVLFWKSAFHDTKVSLSTWRNKRYLPYIVSAGIALCSYFSIYILSKISTVFNIISGKYAVFAMFFISPAVASYVATEFHAMSATDVSFSSSKRRKRKTKSNNTQRKGTFFKSRYFWTSVIILLTLATIVFYPYWFQPNPARWSKAYEAIDNSETSVKGNWFRVESIPRHPAQIVMQMSLRIPMVNGWFGQGGEKNNKIFLRRTYWDIGHQDAELEKKLFLDPNYDPDPTIRALRIFNVKYIVLDEEDPVSSASLREITSKIAWSLNRSNLVKLFYKNDSVLVFELGETYPTMASTNAFVMARENISYFYEVVSNEDFTPSLGVFLSKSSDLEGLSVKTWDGNFENDGYVNATIDKIEVKGMTMDFYLTVDRDCLVSIPISHSSSLKAEIDGHDVRMLKALPAFVCVQVPAGTHRITISRIVTPIEVGSLIASILTLVCLVALLPICYLRRRRQYPDHRKFGKA